MPDHHPPDDLLALMQAGDLAALDTFARAYGPTLLAVARRQCRLAADAEDAVQQALEVASRSMTSIRSDGAPLAWLSTLVARTCYRMNRLSARTEPLGDSAPCGCDDPSRAVEHRELAAALSDALMALGRTDRLMFLLAVEGFNSVEIAERFGLSHNAVRSRLKRARKRLRVAIEASDTLAPVTGTQGLPVLEPRDHDQAPAFDPSAPSSPPDR